MIEEEKNEFFDYIGEYNFKDYYRQPFLTENSVSECFCYGKLNFTDSSMKKFLTILIENDI
tara:strand:+ start:815 stop:997 length:183 start_codon:yes stop_codon:yes gene_type:complete